MALGLGNFAGQLTADELRRAIAAAGGNPDTLDLPEPQLQTPGPASEPMPAAPPADELTAQPAEQLPRPAEAPAPDMSVERATGGPQKAIKQYQDANLDDANAQIALKGEVGESKAQTHRDMAGILGRQAEQSKTNTDAAKERVREGQAHEDRMRAEADRIYEQMRANAQPPPQSTMSKVMGIVGAVASLGGRSGAAQGAAMLSSLFGGDTDRWAAEQAANSNLYKAALSGVSSDREGQVNDLDVAGKIIALEGHEVEAALKQVEQMGLSQNATQAARDLQLQARQKVREGLMEVEAQKAKAAAARGNAAQRDMLMRQDIPTLRQLQASGGGELVNEVLAYKIKQDQADKGGYAKIAKDMAEGGEGGVQKGVGGGAVIPGLKLNKAMGDVTPKEYDEAQKINDGVAALESALTSMEKTQGSFDTDDKAEYERSFALAVGGLNTLANAGVLNPGELKAWEKRLPAHVISNTLTIDPAQKVRAALGDEEKQIGDLRKQLKEIAGVKLRSRGYAFDDGDAGNSDPFAAFGGKMHSGSAPTPAPAPRRAPEQPRSGPGFEHLQPEVAQAVRDAEEFMRRSSSGPGGGF